MTLTTDFALVDKRRSFWNAGPLIFSTFYFFPLVFTWQQNSLTELVWQFVIYIAFVALYWRSISAVGHTLVSNIVLMTLLCIGGSFVTTGTSSLFGFIAFFCGFGLTKPFKIVAFIMLIVLILLTTHFIVGYYSVYFLMPALCVSGGLFFFGWMEYRERIHRELKRQSDDEIKRLGAVAERERIARDLHDLLGHSLSSIALKAELAGKFISANALSQAQDESQQVAALAREALSEVRQAVSGYNKLALDAQLHILASRLKDKGIAVTSTLQGVELEAKVEAGLCFFAKEICTNIIRHSDADKVTIRLQQEQTAVVLQISENGSVQSITEGNGLSGLRQRLEALDVQFQYHISQGVCFSARVERPV